MDSQALRARRPRSTAGAGFAGRPPSPPGGPRGSSGATAVPSSPAPGIEVPASFGVWLADVEWDNLTRGYGRQIRREDVPHRRYPVQRRSVRWNAPEAKECLPVAHRTVADEQRYVPRRKLRGQLFRRRAHDLPTCAVARETLREDLMTFGVEHGENVGPLCAQQGWGGQSGQRGVFREAGAARERERPRGGQRDADAGEGAGADAGQDKLHIVKVRPGEA